MAKHVGQIQMTGKLGSLSFYIDKNGNRIVREHPGPGKQKMKKGRTMKKFRMNGKEFGSASASGKKIRTGFALSGKYAKDGSHVNRLTSLLRDIAMTDTLNEHGMRHAFNGNISLLEGFQWNNKLSLEDALMTDFAAFIDPATGDANAIINSFQPTVGLNRPGFASHFKLIVVTQGFNRMEFSINHNRRTGWESKVLKIDGKETGTITVDLPAPVKDNNIVLLAMGVVFYESINGKLLELHGGAFNIVKTCRTGIEDLTKTACFNIHYIPWEGKSNKTSI